MDELLDNHKIETFLSQIFRELAVAEISVENFYLDHICYRVGSRERYDFLKQELLENNELIAESVINGRPICNFLLEEPLAYKERLIDVLELPAPKAFSHYSEGYEHVEFVITSNLADFIAAHPAVSFDLKGMEKEVNRDVRLSMGAISVKFHEKALLDVILAEQAKPLEKG